MKVNKYLVLSAIIPFAGLLYNPSSGLAAPILGTELASFSVLGATPGVTNIGATTLTGQLGVGPAASISGQSTITINGLPALTTGAAYVHTADAFAGLAQTQLSTARTNLGLLGPGTTLGVDLTGLTIFPGVYTVPAGTSNLTGTVTLDGLGNANAAWVFQMESTLITSPGSSVIVANTGSGAGIFWNVRSSATIDTTTSFQGNILALTTISLKTGATIVCGRALANTGAVTMENNTIDVCAGNNGFGGGLDVPPGGGLPTTLPPAPIPEPGTMMLLGSGLVGLVGYGRKRLKK